MPQYPPSAGFGAYSPPTAKVYLQLSANYGAATMRPPVCISLHLTVSGAELTFW